MKCPACGHDNIAGADICGRCEAALMQEDVPLPTTPVTRSLMTDAIAELQPPSAECVPSGTSAADAIAHMQATNKGYVCVTNPDGTLAGIFTEREVVDLVADQVRDLGGVTVDSLMTRQATALNPSASIAYGLHVMAVHSFRHVPLVDDDGRPTGILASRRVVQYIQEIT